MMSKVSIVLAIILLCSISVLAGEAKPQSWNLEDYTQRVIDPSALSAKVAAQSLMASGPASSLSLKDVITHEKIYNRHAEGLRQQIYEQTYKNIPVFNSYYGITTINKKPVLIKSRQFNDIDVSTAPGISAEKAVEIAQKVAQIKSKESIAAALVILPQEKNEKIKYYLAYKVDFPLQANPPSQFTAFIDAHTGNMLQFYDNLVYGSLSGKVTGMVFPENPTDQKVEVPFQHNTIKMDSAETLTNQAGDYQFEDADGNITLSASLEGLFVKVLNDELEESYHSAAITAPAVYDFSWNSSDTSYKQEESNVFYHTNIVHDFFTKGVPYDIHAMDFQMPARVNIDSTCNAFYSSYDRSINFFRAGDSCESTALSSDIIYHEYTHGVVDQVIKIPFPYWDQTGNMNEGWADYFACNLNNNTCLSEGFAGMNCLRTCNDTDRFPEDYDPEPHSGTEIFSGSMWDLRQPLGVDFANNLIIMAMKLQPESFSEFLENVLIADDDNGNISDSTPHIAEICDAFANKHGIVSGLCAGYTDDPLASISSPTIKSKLKGTINILGSAYPGKNGTFERYELYYGVGENPALFTKKGITLADSGTQPVAGGVLGSWDTEILEDGIYTLRLTVYADDAIVEFRTLAQKVPLDIFEPDDLPEQASLIPTDGTLQSHTLNPMFDEDYVKFSVTAGQAFTITTSNLNNTFTFLTLYDTDGTTTLATDDKGGYNRGSRITYLFNKTGTYYAKVHDVSGWAAGSYDISIQKASAFITSNFSDRGIDEDGNSLFDKLAVDVEVVVNSPGEYALWGELWDKNRKYITDAYVQKELDAGANILTLDFNGIQINRNQVDGPYNLAYLSLRDQNSNIQNMVDAYQTFPYNVSQFEMPAARFTGSFSDYGNDTDGNGKFDTLDINAEIQVDKATSVSISGRLVDQEHQSLDYADRFFFTLQPGKYNLTLKFSGETVFRHSRNGPFILEYIQLRGEDGTFDSLQDAYLTFAYNFTDFDPAAFPTGGFADKGIDLNNNSLFDTLTVTAEVNVTESGRYFYNTYLTDQSENYIDDVYDDIFLNEGINYIGLNFSGMTIYRKGRDGPYVLQRFSISMEEEDDFAAKKVSLAENNDAHAEKENQKLHNDPVYTTGPYSFTDFERPSAQFSNNFTDFGFDTDNNTLFDFLVIEAGLNVSTSSTFDIAGTLCDEGHDLDFSEVEIDDLQLSEGIYSIPLNFSGQEINFEEINGPYNLCHLRLRDTIIGESLENRRDIYFTQPYNFTQFEPFMSKLKISDLDMQMDDDLISNITEGDTVIAKAGSDIRFILEIHNTDEQNELDDIEVNIEIKRIREGESEFLKARLSNLGPGEKGATMLQFDVPEDARQGVYDVEIFIEGEDDANRIEHKDKMSLFLSIQDDSVPPAEDAMVANVTQILRDIAASNTFSAVRDADICVIVKEDEADVYHSFDVIVIDGAVNISNATGAGDCSGRDDEDFIFSFTDYSAFLSQKDELTLSSFMQHGSGDRYHIWPSKIILEGGDVNKSEEAKQRYCPFAATHLSRAEMRLYGIAECIAANAPPVISSFDPAFDPIITEDGSQLFSITASDPEGDAITTAWSVGDSIVANSTSYTFVASGAGTFTITVIVSDGSANSSKTWTLMATAVPVAEQFDGSTTNFSAIPDLGNAENITLEKTAFGKIDFTEPLNLSDVADLTNTVVIQGNLVAIDSGRQPELNRSARITLQGLSYSSQPQIFFDGSFTTDANSISKPCDFCTLVAFTQFPTTNGIVVFDVAHFSSFRIGQLAATAALPLILPKLKVEEFKIEHVGIDNEVISAKDPLVASANIKNIGEVSTKTARMAVVIPELGVRKSIGPFKLGKEDEVLKQVLLELPAETPPGEYLVRITISSEKVRRVKHRYVRIV